ncbi:lipocalin family protein [Thermopolyspora sp. NPDC052614]|uniref:lipocalin family protein n=1 Tax=Thermopolyspora sp. NPDC052614 TaxID=3155682 RepID=UPI003440AAFE
MEVPLRRATGIKLTVALTALLASTFVPTGAQAAGDTNRDRPVTTAGNGIPAMVDPNADLAAKTPGPETRWADSIYFTSQVKAGGHDMGLLVHTINVPKGFGRLVSFAVTDVTAGWYKNYMLAVDPEDYKWSTTGLDISAPGLRWTGNAEKMSVSLDVPWGSLDVTLTSRGPVLNYGGTGVFPILGDTNYEYAFPDMRTTGTLTIDGKTQRVTGRSWLDRQWGPTPDDPSLRWTWMNLNLPNGDAVAIWDARSDKGENSFATVMRRDGSHEVVAVEPVEKHADKFWTSPVSGQKYPTRWRINIPALSTRLTVTITGTVDQEFAQGENGRLEATAAFTGTYKNTKVSGKNYVEMISDWRP